MKMHTVGYTPSRSYMLERGRSMVEMLGVLAIIGVLSIGGILGYSAAMDRHKANLLLGEISMRITDMARQEINGLTTPSLSGWEATQSGFDFSVVKVEGKHYAQVASVPPRICQIVLDTLPNNVDIYFYGAENTECDQENNNTMQFRLKWE